MFVTPASGATAPTVSLAATSATATATATTKRPIPADSIRHLLFGTPSAVQATIQQLHQRGYAEPNDWSRPISTGRPGEVMAILTKRVPTAPAPR